MRKPIAVYNAATNIEAHAVKLLLVESGVEAFAVDDVSVVGLWAFGTLPEIHKPQVWIDEADLDRAMPILQAYEKQQVARVAAASSSDARLSISVVCEDCGQPSEFPASDRGKIRQCPHCRNYVDVEEADEEPDYWRLEDEE
jgi:hypothetical protein